MAAEASKVSPSVTPAWVSLFPHAFFLIRLGFFLHFRTRVRRRRTPWESSAFASSAWTSASARAETDWPVLLRCWNSSQGRHPSSPKVSWLPVVSQKVCVSFKFKPILIQQTWFCGSGAVFNLLTSIISLSCSPLHCAILRYPQKWKDCCPLHCSWCQSRGDPGERTQGQPLHLSILCKEVRYSGYSCCILCLLGILLIKWNHFLS